MDSFAVGITGDHAVELRLDAFPDALYEALRDEIDALSQELFARVEAATPVKTGALRGAERVRLFTDPERISGYVDIAGPKGSGGIYAKAAALEYGAHRPTKVAAHAMRLDHHWAQKLAEPELVLVAAYTRTPNILEHAFERGPLDAMSAEIVSRLKGVVETVVADTNA
jgi:hypothetical protein